MTIREMNIAEIQSLATEADDKRTNLIATSPPGSDERINATYWGGVRDGLLRSITVLQGKETS